MWSSVRRWMLWSHTTRLGWSELVNSHMQCCAMLINTECQAQTALARERDQRHLHRTGGQRAAPAGWVKYEDSGLWVNIENGKHVLGTTCEYYFVHRLIIYSC